MKRFSRSCYCAELNIKNLGQDVRLYGWVQKKREMGKLVFIDLRDRTGIVQLSLDDTADEEIFEIAHDIKTEDVIEVFGKVRERVAKNDKIPTGDIEVEIKHIKILSKSKTPPFEISKSKEINEELRLKYRYLELRNPQMQKNIFIRHQVAKIAREYFYGKNFIEVETPILIKSTPEGARDYLVPSRVFKGKFFALPQSPQIYKQLAMVSGFDRYIQIARCFRDEDLRADRQPEFTQIDIEASFVDSEDIMEMAEEFIKKIYKEILNIEVKTPFTKIPYQEAMRKYGSDKPDTRFGLEIVNIEDEVKYCNYKVFSDTIKNSGAVRGINAKGLSNFLTRKEIDKLTEKVKGLGAKGLSFTKINEDTTSSSTYEKFLNEEEIKKVRNKMQAEAGDVIFIVADENINFVLETLGILRCELAEKFDLIKDKNTPNLNWVIDFPLFEYDKEERRYFAKHHPFTSPKEEDEDNMEKDPQKVRAKAYDLVLNGNEIGGGSIRINRREIQDKMFKVLGLDKEEAEKKFGFLLEAFKYGVPPHGGIAFGLDRLVCVMLGCENIREVIAFPKVSTSAELMTDSPGEIDKKQMEELGLKLEKHI